MQTALESVPSSRSTIHARFPQSPVAATVGIANFPAEDEQEMTDDWTRGVLDKYADYQRYAARHAAPSAIFGVQVVGAATAKTVLLELMLSEIFVSTTMLRVEASQTMRRQTRGDSLPPRPASTVAPPSQPPPPTAAESPAASPSPPPVAPPSTTFMDLLKLSVKRANLVFSEHSPHRTPVETTQILNFALRQCSLRVEREANNDTRLRLALDEIEGGK